MGLFALSGRSQREKRPGRLRSGAAFVVLFGVAGLLAPGCDRQSAKKKASTQPSRSSVQELVPPPAIPPQYQFADPKLKTEHPEVAAFVTRFLETCLAGDYLGYRQLVSRYDNPESKERFTAIYHGLRSVTVERIEPLVNGAGEEREKKGPVYRVICSPTFVDSSKALRHNNRKIALLVFQEEGAWRMRPAPASLQPRDEHAATQPADSQPAEPIPDYPWDKDEDW